MTEVFDLIPSSTLLNLAALVVYVLIVRRITVFSFVLVGVMIIEALHQGISFYLQSFFTAPDTWALVKVSWYTSFALTDFLFYGLTVHLTHTYRLEMDNVSKIVIHLYLVMGFIQLVRLAERYITNSEIMGVLYSNSIVLITMVISFLLIGYVGKVFIQNFLPNNRV